MGATLAPMLGETAGPTDSGPSTPSGQTEASLRVPPLVGCLEAVEPKGEVENPHVWHGTW
jgi:hypothetical protein